MAWLRPLVLRLGCCLALLGLAGPTFAQDVQPVPALSERVIDRTGTLSAADTAALVAKLAAFEQQAGPQIVVLMVATTQPEDIASYAQRVGETWKIGRREVGDGLLLVIAKDDRRLWIAPAKALEGAVPDLAARQIVRDVISPRFKNRDYAGGINAGVDALMARIQGEALPAPSERSRPSRGLGQDPMEWLIFGFIALPILATVLRGLLGRGLGSMAAGGASGALAWLVTQSLWLAALGGFIGLLIALFGGLGHSRRSARGGHGGWIDPGGGWSSGGGGFGSGGGGFSSGGGGDFGGGGAGGDW